ncbi:MAG: AhpC/TSA family protein [Bacteroidia bacterium]|nr:AhpC/TSA family protein [Bacteroidia bacterium]
MYIGFKCFVCLLWFSFLSAQKKFTIEGTAHPAFNGKYLYIHHKWNNQDKTDSVKVVKGKFIYKGQTPEPNMYWFTPERVVSYPVNCIFFVDEGTLTARIKNLDSFPLSEINGGKTQKEYQEYLMLVNLFVRKQQNLQQEYTRYVQEGNYKEANEINIKLNNLNTEYINALKDFVKARPKSAVSGYLIYKEFSNPAVPLEIVEEFNNLLDEQFKKTKFGQLASERIRIAQGTRVGGVATDFTLPDPNGKQISLSSFRGKYVLVDFWASWCGPCRMENPYVVDAYNQFKDKNFTILGVSLDNNRERWLDAIQKDGLTWTHVSDLKGWASDVARLYGINAIPQNFLIGPDGVIIAKNLRGHQLSEKLHEVIKDIHIEKKLKD